MSREEEYSSRSCVEVQGTALHAARPLPCPFCGGEASASGSISYSERHEAWWPDGSRVRDAYFVNCISCGIDNKGLIGHQSPNQALAAWNRRAPDAETPALLEALRAADDALCEHACHAGPHVPCVRTPGECQAACGLAAGDALLVVRAAISQATASSDDHLSALPSGDEMNPSPRDEKWKS